jgi:hypothetical protein
MEKRSDDMVGAFDQQLAEISIAGSLDAELEDTVPRLAASRSLAYEAQDHSCAHVP